MKRTLLYLILVLVVIVVSCNPKKDDVYLNLSAEQIKFITTAHAGDTVIWQQDGGLRDTGIVQKLIHERALEDVNGNPQVYNEYAYYGYDIVGSNKFINSPEIFVGTNLHDNSLLKTVSYGGGGANGVIPNRKFGGVDYTNVFFGVLNGTTDTTFWSAEGYLGYIRSGVKVERVK